MDDTLTPQCGRCATKACAEGRDCFGTSEGDLMLYAEPDVANLHHKASAVEARYYCKAPRLQETILFAKEMGCRKVGLAFCIGLSEEARVIEQIFSEHFNVASVCCKVSGMEKKTFGLEQIRPGGVEVTCNPAGQAALLNKAGTQLNIICGLCVGHDAVFAMHSEAPVTTLVVKDRVLAHNPLGAVYCGYVRRKLEGNRPSERERQPTEKRPQ